MKKFSFPLEKLRLWRQRQMEAEVVRLGQLQAESEALRLRSLALLREQEIALDVVRSSTELSVDALHATDAFRDWCGVQILRLQSARTEADRRVSEQREKVCQARVKVESLDRIRERRRAVWTAEVDRETENMVQELVIARWAAGAAAGGD